MNLILVRQKIVRFIRSGQAVDMAINLVCPWLVYTLTEPSLGKVHALMASAIPPIIWSLIEFAWKRRIDALSILVLAGIGLSLLAFLGGGGYRMLQLREHLVPAVIALALLGSVAIKRPLLVVFARAAAKRISKEESEKLERELKNERVWRLVNRLNLFIGAFLLLQVAIAVSLIFILPIKEFLIVSPIVNYTMLGLLAGAFLYFKPRIVAVFKAAKQSQPEPGL